MPVAPVGTTPLRSHIAKRPTQTKPLASHDAQSSYGNTLHRRAVVIDGKVGALAFHPPISRLIVGNRGPDNKALPWGQLIEYMVYSGELLSPES